MKMPRKVAGVHWHLCVGDVICALVSILLITISSIQVSIQQWEELPCYFDGRFDNGTY